MKDYLDKSGLEIIVVAIDLNPEGEERVNEYCPWGHGEVSKQILGYASPSGYEEVRKERCQAPCENFTWCLTPNTQLERF